MIPNVLNHLSKRTRGAKKLFLAAMPFALAGYLFATGIEGVPSSIAENTHDKNITTTFSQSTVPDSFAELAQQLSPTVVNVKVTKIEKAHFQSPYQGRHFNGKEFGDFFHRFFEGIPQMPKNHRTQGAGSGVIISKDGYILSNNHVVEGAQNLVVTLADKQEYEAEIVGRDPKTDLAVLKIETKKDLPVATMGNSEQLKVGDWVVAIGNPFGLSHTVTSGIVSAKGRVIGAGPYDDFIQTDASINPGNSGGPLFNMKGEVVGINTAIIPQGQGIGFAIPVDTAKPLIPQLVEDGQITRGYLGVNIQHITSELAEAMGQDKAQGALVTDVMDDSPAAAGGILRGDIITHFDGKEIETSHNLPARVAATPVGKKVEVNVLRDGSAKQLSIKVGKLDGDEKVAGKYKEVEKGKWGLQLHDLNPELEKQFRVEADQGVVVVGVEPGSAADEAGVKQGDVIIEVNRKAVTSVDDVKDTIKKAPEKDALLLLVERKDGTMYIPLKEVG